MEPEALQQAQAKFIDEAFVYAEAFLDEFQDQIASGKVSDKQAYRFEHSERISQIQRIIENPQLLEQDPQAVNRLMKAVRDMDNNNVSSKSLNEDEWSTDYVGARSNFRAAAEQFTASIGQNKTDRKAVEAACSEVHQGWHEGMGQMLVGAKNWTGRQWNTFWENPIDNLKGAGKEIQQFDAYLGTHGWRALGMFSGGVVCGVGAGVGLFADLGRLSTRKLLNVPSYLTGREEWLKKPKGDGGVFAKGGYDSFSTGWSKGLQNLMHIKPENTYERVLFTGGKATGEIGGVIVGSVFTGGAVGAAWAGGWVAITGGNLAASASAAASTANAAAATAAAGALVSTPKRAGLQLSARATAVLNASGTGFKSGAHNGWVLLRPYTVRDLDGGNWLMRGRIQDAAAQATSSSEAAAKHLAGMQTTTKGTIRHGWHNFRYTRLNGDRQTRWSWVTPSAASTPKPSVHQQAINTRDRFQAAAAAYRTRYAHHQPGSFQSILYATDDGGRVLGWVGGIEAGMAAGVAWPMFYFESAGEAALEQELEQERVARRERVDERLGTEDDLRALEEQYHLSSNNLTPSDSFHTAAAFSPFSPGSSPVTQAYLAGIYQNAAGSSFSYPHYSLSSNPLTHDFAPAAAAYYTPSYVPSPFAHAFLTAGDSNTPDLSPLIGGFPMTGFSRPSSSDNPPHGAAPHTTIST